MKQNELIKRCGPYRVFSISQGKGGIRLVVFPAFPAYGESWAITRERGEGGGPSIFTAVTLAHELEEFLNQPYTEEAIQGWKATLGIALE